MLYIVKFFEQVARDISKCQLQFLLLLFAALYMCLVPFLQPVLSASSFRTPQRLTSQVETAHIPTGSQLMEKLLSLL